MFGANPAGQWLYNWYTDENTYEDEKKAIEEALSKPVNSLDDLYSMLVRLKADGIILNIDIPDLINRFGIKDLGPIITSETITAISNKLSSGSALSLNEAS